MTTLTRLELEVRGPYDLAEVAVMGFGNRDERRFDGVMRIAFCLDGDYERQVGVTARQAGSSVELEVVLPPGSHPLGENETERVRAQIARVISLDHDGAAFHRLCESDPALAAAHRRAPGFRPALFHSPYEAAVCSIVSARRSRRQGLAQLGRLAEQSGVTLELAGHPTAALPTPSRLLTVESMPGLPASRIARLHAVAEAAGRGELDAGRLRRMPPAQAMVELQRLPGIGPFYSSLIVERACGHADVLPTLEAHTRRAVERAYGVESLSEARFADLVERWRPFRTWVLVMLRSQADRTGG